MIHIVDGQTDTILDYIPLGEFWHDKHYKSLKDTMETFDFTTFGDKPFAEYLTKMNRVVIPDEDGKFIEFIIQNTRKYRSPNGGLFIEVYTSASYIELRNAKVIRPQRLEGYTATQHVDFALAGTVRERGRVDYAGIRSITIENYTNPYSYIKTAGSTLDLEPRFHVETDGNKITHRYVDLIEHVGEWQGREVEFGSDLIGIERSEDTSNVVTALIGIGPEREDGTRLEVLVEDEDALQRWGRRNPQTGELMHIIDVYEPTSVDMDMTESRLRELTQNELEKRVNSVVEYKGDIADLEKVPGMENKKIRFGDTIKIKDVGFNPPLYLEARVHTQERSLSNPSDKKVTLGDYIEYTEEEVMAIWKQLQARIEMKVSMSEVTEVVYTKGEVDERDIPGNEAKEKLDRDVGEAVVETTTGSQSKADQAEQNAINEAESIAEQKKQLAIQAAVDEAEAQINTAKGELESSIAEKADATWVSSQLQLKADSDTVQAIQGTIGDLQDTASSLQQAVSDHADELEAQDGRITTVATDLDTVEGQLSATITDLSSLEGVVSQQRTDINANAGAIALKASQDDLDTVSGNVNSISGQLTVLAGEIEAKAEKSTVQTLEGDVTKVSNDLASLTVEVGGIESSVSSLSQTVSNQGTSISDLSSSYTQLAGLVESKVDRTTYETDKNGIINRLDDTETRITQTETSLEGKVESTTYQQDMTALEGDITSIETRMGSAEASITANTNAINLKANATDVYTKSEVDGAIDGIQIGGRNLTRYSGKSHYQYGKGFQQKNIVVVDGKECMSFTGYNDILYLNSNDNPIMTIGEHYTFSFYAKASEPLVLKSVYLGPGNSGFIPNTAIGTDWKKYSFSLVSKSENPLRIHMYPTINNGDGTYKTFYLADWKLEKGTKATDWTPAPEDIQADIDTKVDETVYTSKMSELDVSINGITANVSSLQTTVNNHGTSISQAQSDIQAVAGQVSTKAEASEVSALGTRVTTAEQNISALDGEISSKVSTSVFNALEGRVQQAESDITQTAQDVTFSFERLDDIDNVLDSAVTTIDQTGVTVKDGSFYLEDDQSTTKYSVVAETNHIQDHSFEMLQPDGDYLSDGTFKIKSYDGSVGGGFVNSQWFGQGTPRLHSIEGTDAGLQSGTFGYKAVLVNSANWVYQNALNVHPNKPYTLSAYFSKHYVHPNTIQGRLRIRLYREEWNGNESSSVLIKEASTSVVVPSSGFVRGAVTIILPDYDTSKFHFLEVSLYGSGSGSWVRVDGVQLVEGEYSTLYAPEDNYWHFVNGRNIANIISADKIFLNGDPVVERGSNSNGNYARFADGLQICWYHTEQNIAINNPYGSLYQNVISWTYPATFAVSPIVSVGEARWTTGASWGTPTNTTRLNTEIRILDVLSRASGATKIDAIAVGRWK